MFKGIDSCSLQVELLKDVRCGMAVDKRDQTNKTCVVPGQSTGLKHLQVTLFQVFIGEWNERKEACFGNFGN